MGLISALVFLFFCVIAFFVIYFIIRKIRSLTIQPQTNHKYQQTYESPSKDDTYGKIKKRSIEDSEGDGLVLFDDPMFPPEFDDEEEEAFEES